MTSYLNFNELKGFEREVVLAEIGKLIEIANDYNGVVFGGYVRGVLVPRSKDPKCDVKFKDVDLWFTQHDDAVEFLTSLGESVKHAGKFDRSITKDPYPFDRQQYHYFVHGTCIAWIDVIIAKELPVDDLDVNCVIYSKGDFAIGTPKYDLSLSSVIENILSKKAQILPPLIDLFGQKDKHFKQTIQDFRLQERYLKLGWRISYKDQVWPGRGPFSAWLKSILKSGTPALRELSTIEDVLMAGIRTQFAKLGIEEGPLKTNLRKMEDELVAQLNDRIDTIRKRLIQQ